MTNICKHTHDNGHQCASVAARGRDYCAYHLHHRARLLRMAQVRARNERFDLRLPPLEDMFAVQSALNQLVEAVAADMLDLKRADFLLKAVRSAAQNLKWVDKWPASIAHSAEPVSAGTACEGVQFEGAPSLSPAVGDRVGYIDLSAEYGLPDDLDLSIAPEVAFPQSAILSEERSDESAQRVGGKGAPPLSPSFGNRVGASLSPMPTVDYCRHGPGCPEHTIRADYPETPELAELREIQATQGEDAMVDRYKQQQRNQRRRYNNTSHKRYAAIALEKNLRLAAERLAERKLAERDAQSAAPPKKPAASVSAPAPEAETAMLSPTGSNG
jgi:hypothetical protein